MSYDSGTSTEKGSAEGKASGGSRLYISGMGYMAPKYRKEEAETPPDYKRASGGFNIRMRAKGYERPSESSFASSGSGYKDFSGSSRDYDPFRSERSADSSVHGGGYGSGGYTGYEYSYGGGYAAYEDGSTIAYGMGEEIAHYSIDPSALGIILVDRTDGMREITLSSIRKSILLLGRDKDSADILVQAKSVGRQHGSFRYQDGAYYFCDENSTNGTYYLNNGNYVRVESNRLIGPLKEGMTFLLGGSRIEGSQDRESVLMIVTNRSNEHPYTKFALNEQQYTIGRGEDCDIVLDQPAVSRHHARVYYYNDRYVIEDSGSRNGVFLNGV